MLAEMPFFGKLVGAAALLGAAAGATFDTLVERRHTASLDDGDLYQIAWEVDEAAGEITVRLQMLSAGACPC